MLNLRPLYPEDTMPADTREQRMRRAAVAMQDELMRHPGGASARDLFKILADRGYESTDLQLAAQCGLDDGSIVLGRHMHLRRPDQPEIDDDQTFPEMDDIDAQAFH